MQMPPPNDDIEQMLRMDIKRLKTENANLVEENKLLKKHTEVETDNISKENKMLTEINHELRIRIEEQSKMIQTFIRMYKPD